MSLRFDFSHLTNADLTTLSIALAIIVLLFLFLLFTQRKHLAKLLQASQYRVDLDRYEKQAGEAQQRSAEARENFEQAKQAMADLDLDAEDSNAERAADEEH
ncbi:MAG: hypothetical protein FWF45_01300 [Coriobacteriia bacterium]|nr:hypothetical protein [Coriobacteriia bacterium]